MKTADYIVDFLAKNGVTSVFGLPGGSVLDFLYALDRRRAGITPRLTYHEQAAAFAACGYAQAHGKPGVAYSTKGPGFTNMITGIADAHHNSIPVLFVTAHGNPTPPGLRFGDAQELDTVRMVAGITKYAARVDAPEDIPGQMERAWGQMISGRNGPAVLDFAVPVFQAATGHVTAKPQQPAPPASDSCQNLVSLIQQELRNARRPVLLIGDGINQSGTRGLFRKFADAARIPVLSSRFAADVIPDSPYYFGYIGSHGTRYGNFILSKCDLVVALGNRVAHNPESQSFGAYSRRTKTIRIDIDKNELGRALPRTINHHADLKTLMPALANANWPAPADEDWLNACHELKDALRDCDTAYPVTVIADIIKSVGNDAVLVSDVGNNEMWLARAYACSDRASRLLFSNNFGSLGCSLPKAIGAYYATRGRVVCFAGDLGFLMNSQELQFIAHENLPITIVILNTFSSAMIRERQKKKGYGHCLHTTLESGYSVPEFGAVARAFNIPFLKLAAQAKAPHAVPAPKEGPVIMEIQIDPALDVTPFLPQGRPFQDFDPPLPRELYERLDRT